MAEVLPLGARYMDLEQNLECTFNHIPRVINRVVPAMSLEEVLNGS
jgi:hypothetical protein